MSDTVRLHVIFHGRVQGVFFRATTREIARQLGVTGYVWNLPDGSVEMEAQAAPYVLNELLTRIQQQYEGHVTRVERRDLPLHDDERDFEIRRER